MDGGAVRVGDRVVRPVADPPTHLPLATSRSPYSLAPDATLPCQARPITLPE